MSSRLYRGQVFRCPAYLHFENYDLKNCSFIAHQLFPHSTYMNCASLEEVRHRVDNSSSSKHQKYTLTQTHQQARTQAAGAGLDRQQRGRADDRGRGAAFITIALAVTPAINTGRLSPLNLSLRTMHIIPLSQNRPGDTRKHLEILCIVWWPVYLEIPPGL